MCRLNSDEITKVMLLYEKADVSQLLALKEDINFFINRKRKIRAKENKEKISYSSLAIEVFGRDDTSGIGLVGRCRK